MFLANENNYNPVLTGIVLGAFLLFGIIVSIPIIIDKIKTGRVKKNSPYYLEIKRIYDTTQFKVVNMKYTRDYNVLNTKRKFDSFMFTQRCTEYIKENYRIFASIVDSIEYNKKTLAEYNNMVKAVPHTTDEELAKRIKVSLKTIVRKETKLASVFVKDPTINYQVVVIATYTSPKGRNTYNSKSVFPYDVIKRNVESIRAQEKANNEKIVNSQRVSEVSKPKKPVKQDNFEQGSNSSRTDRIIHSIDDLEEID